MIKKGQKVEGSKVLVLGITFKENCPDIRNSRVIDVIRELQDFGCDVEVSDYWADKEEVEREYKLKLIENANNDDYDAVVLAVAHDEYKEFDLESSESKVIFDIKSILKDSDGRL